MATPRTVIWADAFNNRLVNGWRGLVSAIKPRFRQGDKVQLTIRWVEPPLTTGSQMGEVELAGTDEYVVNIGQRGARPTSGTWFVSYGGYDSDPIPYGASPDVVQSILNRVPSISNTGGLYVSQSNGDIYKLNFYQKGARSAMTVNGKSLFPVSEGEVNVAQVGDANNRQIVTIALRQLPVTSADGFTDEPACVAGVEELKPDIWDVYLTSDAKDGYFMLSIDGDDPVKVSVFEDYSSLQTKIGVGFTVIRAGDFRWRIQKNDGTAFEPAIESSSEIVSFNGKVGEVSLDTQEAYEFLSGAKYADATLEILRTWPTGKQMVVQVPCTLLNKIYP